MRELRRVRRICRFKEFVAALHGERLWACWRENEAPAAFDGHLDCIEVVLGLGSGNGHWVLLSL